MLFRSSWAALLDGVKCRTDLSGPIKDLVVAARQAVEKGIMRRVHSMAELGRHRTHLDQAYLDNHPDEDRETSEMYLLSMSDFFLCRDLAEELPLVASAYRLSGDPLFLDHASAQLQEMTSWSPLQRKMGDAWGVFDVWLATGTGIRAIHDTLEILPANAQIGRAHV